MIQNTIDAEITACDALSLQATQAGAQAFARAGEEHIFYERDGCGGPLDIRDDGADHWAPRASASKVGKRCAIGSPVKLATHPSGVPKKRMAQK